MLKTPEINTVATLQFFWGASGGRGGYMVQAPIPSKSPGKSPASSDKTDPFDTEDFAEIGLLLEGLKLLAQGEPTRKSLASGCEAGFPTLCSMFIFGWLRRPFHNEESKINLLCRNLKCRSYL